jgi:hypothetical protein
LPIPTPDTRIPPQTDPSPRRGPKELGVPDEAARCFAGFAIGTEGEGTADLSIWKATSADAEPTLECSIETGADQAFQELAIKEAREAIETMNQGALLN